MADHKHEWAFGIRMWVDGTPEIATCMVEGCDAIMKQEEIERRLNAVEKLTAEDAGRIAGTYYAQIYAPWNNDCRREVYDRWASLSAYARALEGKDAL